MKFEIKNFFLQTRFFLAGVLIVILFITGFIFNPVLYIAKIVLIIFFTTVVADAILLFRNEVMIDCRRVMPRIFSLSDENRIDLEIISRSDIPLNIILIEELPEQFQERNFKINLKILPKTERKLNYFVRPLSRGQYQFGNTLLFIRSVLGFVERKITINQTIVVPVYPSIIQMKNMELRAFSKVSQFQGIRKLRRLGHSYEFEQIKNYVNGDDYRSINWKATGKKASIMVNQYEDERAQQVYFIIDKSRSMRMPFKGLSLLDYAINTTLVMANIILRKQDRAGLITFSTKVDAILKAERTHTQIRRISRQLYNEKENKNESNYELLYTAIKNTLNARSLLILFTNFESTYSMERVLPILRKLNRQHLLLVVFFTNLELINFAAEESADIEDIYLKMVARNFIEEKENIRYQLKLYGIQSLQTAPEDMTVNVVNKYLELKSRGMI